MFHVHCACTRLNTTCEELEARIGFELGYLGISPAYNDWGI